MMDKIEPSLPDTAPPAIAGGAPKTDPVIQTSSGQVAIIPRYHLYARNDDDDPEDFGWNDMIGAHGNPQVLLDAARRYPPTTRWQVVDIVTFQFVATSDEVPEMKS